VPDLTHPPTKLAALPAAITDPPYAAQILTVTACLLELSPSETLAPPTLDGALLTAAAGVIGDLPAVVVEGATLRARAHLPLYADITHGEYALLLRAAAKELA
jgi:hypothetical protein